MSDYDKSKQQLIDELAAMQEKVARLAGKFLESEGFLNSVFESIQDGIAILDCQLNIIKLNHTMEKWFAEDMPQKIGNRCHKVFHGQNEACKNCATNKTLATGEASSEIIATKDKQGNIENLYEILVYPLFDKSVNEIRGVIQFFRDITESQKMKQEMERFERLNLIGKMAASLGHEIRNPMTTVRGFLQLIMSKNVDGPYNEQFSLMIDELDRANSIISEFLFLANNRTLNLVEKNINNIVHAMTPLIKADANISDVIVQIDTKELPNILLDEKEIRQIILNLVRNGLEAMPGGGSITISTHYTGSEVILAVKDEGSGIPQEYMEKLGTPFFTTKEQGTGLGLAVCFSIATRHDAVIDIDTGPNGTTFYIKFKVDERTI